MYYLMLLQYWILLTLVKTPINKLNVNHCSVFFCFPHECSVVPEFPALPRFPLNRLTTDKVHVFYYSFFLDRYTFLT